jgi:acetyl-CoA carboxylase biotin carboxylase subunit
MAKLANVPVVPGSDGLIENEEDAIKVARLIGYPVLIKATAGGGGKGMRVAANELALKAAIEQAQNEAKAAFGNGGVYLERFIDKPRHVEVQIIADHFGNVCHLHERDCSVQRRHQKLIEESPSPRLPEQARRELCEAAVRLVKAAGYTNSGTVEFIVDQENRFYFIEVNARIQVEHPVTEMVTGIDLIKTQIAVASGKPLPFTQADIVPRGAAIECRINAEDPSKNFQPCPGKIEKIFIPGGYGVRFDSHVSAGYVVPPYYDSMIGKLIVLKDNRNDAIQSMLRCLSELEIQGIRTTADFHKRVLSHADFVQGTVDTKWVERELLSK